MLTDAGIRFRREERLGWYWADLYVPKQPGVSAPTDLEIDGHPRHRTDWGKRRDARRAAQITMQYHVRVIRLSKSEVLGDPRRCLARLAAVSLPT